MSDDSIIKRLEADAVQMRRDIIDMAYNSSGNSHFGAGLSIVEILAVLYGKILKYDCKNPVWQERDRFILSKGHGVLGYYAALKAAGFLTEEDLKKFQTNESPLSSHPVMNQSLGIESSNGSLGHGLSFAVGSLLAGRKKGIYYRAFVLMGNGECNEGSVWEAAMSAAQFGLNNLIAVIDNNKLQSDGDSRQIIDINNYEKRFEAFGWNAINVDGHDVKALLESFLRIPENGRPTSVIADTIKGKGISFMENNNEWHHNRLNEKQYIHAMTELEE